MCLIAWMAYHESPFVAWLSIREVWTLMSCQFCAQSFIIINVSLLHGGIGYSSSLAWSSVREGWAAIHSMQISVLWVDESLYFMKLCAFWWRLEKLFILSLAVCPRGMNCWSIVIIIIKLILCGWFTFVFLFFYIWWPKCLYLCYCLCPL